MKQRQRAKCAKAVVDRQLALGMTWAVQTFF